MEFTKQMRTATREVHSLSDALINAKLGIAMSSDQVWAEGLLMFYEVFKKLEEFMDSAPDSLMAQLDFPGIRRTKLFEQDLEYYLGCGWSASYTPRESVVRYIAHLNELDQTEPVLLLAYIYHLYMGLLSGGQILRRKRALIARLKFNRKHSYQGLAVTEITGVTVYAMKKQITEAMNRIASELDEGTRFKLIEESKKVFQLNDAMVRSIPGTNSILFWKFIKVTSLSLFVGFSAYLLKRYFL